MEKHWFFGGLPPALLSKSDASFARWTDNYIKTFLERDIEHIFGLRLSIPAVRNLWIMLAGHNGAIWDGASLSRSLGITVQTVNKYVDFLEAAFMVYRLPAWFININKRVNKAPKIYIRDTGILHRLCRIGSFEELQGSLTIGSSWEAYVIEQIRQIKPVYIDLFYYRTQHGAESDLVLVKGLTPVCSLEIKYSNSPSISKGFYTSIEDLSTTNNYIVTPGSDRYSTRGVTVCSLIDFLDELRQWV